MKIFKGITIVAYYTLATSLLYGQTKKINMDTLVERLGASFVQAEQVGLSIGVYNRGANYFYNFGSTEKDKIQEPTRNTIYEIGSITKAFVSLILANAVKENKVKLTDDIRKYLVGNFPNLEYDKHPITLLQLSNTTSGIPNWLPLFTEDITKASPDSIPFLIERVYDKYNEKAILKALHNIVLDTIPGFKSNHSNGAALVLSYILEKVYKTSIDDLVHKYIVKPAKMTNTLFLASKSSTKLLAKGYNGKRNEMPYLSTDFLKGVGGLNSSTSDLLKFINLQLDTTNDAIDLTHQKTFNTGWCDIGLSWLIYKHDNGNHQFWADGGTYGFTSYLIFYPEINSGIVILTNKSDPSTSDKISDIAESIFNFITKK